MLLREVLRERTGVALHSISLGISWASIKPSDQVPCQAEGLWHPSYFFAGGQRNHLAARADTWDHSSTKPPDALHKLPHGPRSPTRAEATTSASLRRAAGFTTAQLGQIYLKSWSALEGTALGCRQMGSDRQSHLSVPSASGKPSPRYYVVGK